MPYTLNQIIKKVEDIATNHKQINSFGFGDLHEFSTEAKAMPCLWMELNTGSIDVEDQSFKYNFSLYFLDLVHKDETNETEVLSDQALIASDVYTLLDDEDNADNFLLEKTAALEFFTERTDDEVSGCKLDIVIKTKFLRKDCEIPTA